MAKSEKKRLDQVLVERGLFESRTRAQASIMAGKVLVDGKPGVKAGERVSVDCEIRVTEPDCAYVSRGGTKLEGALDHFGLEVSGLDVLDVGSSTGGFTDCALKRDAKRVTSLDVGKGIIAWSLRTDDRVDLIEGVNARNMGDDIAPGPYDLIVMDVSFISIRLILPNLVKRLKPDGHLLSLIKPQFEAGKGMAPGGIVSDPDTWRDVLETFMDDEIFGVDDPPGLVGFTASPITGKGGNREFFGYWRMGSVSTDEDELRRQINKLIENDGE